VNKSVIVTGAANGIGFHTVNLLIEAGYKVGAVDIDKKALRATRFKSKSTVVKLNADVGDPAQVKKAIKNFEKEVEKVDGLVNNAGFGGPFESLDKISEESWQRVFNTNVKSIFNFCKILLPKMKSQGGGSIVNVASVQGLFGSAGSSTYVASKHAVIGYTRAIASEWASYRIRCNAICPGYIDTSMGARDRSIDDYENRVIKRTPTKGLGRPEEVARWIRFLLDDENKYTNGSVVSVDGGISSDLGILDNEI
jgi:3-oxoacyl-[acyl-carrier protein] reductase